MFPKITTQITDLQKQTITQLRAVIVPTKRDALISLNGGSDRVTDEPIRVYRKDGQIQSQVETVRDVETNAVILTKTITWTYYPKGEVDLITIVENGKKKIIKHFVDGRQPEVL